MGIAPEGSEAVLELSGVTKVYPGSTSSAVEGLRFDLFQGETLSILGPSGCGKTTTLRLIAGFERPDAGMVSLRGQVVSERHRMVPPDKRGVAMVFQEYALFPHLTVSKNIAFGLKNTDSTTPERRVKEILELIDMERLAHRYPHELSGGQKQRVALGRALAPNPLVVLLDEPFSNLDTDMRTHMRLEVQNILHKERATTILVAHDQHEALSFADKVAVMNNGRLEQMGTPEEVYYRPATSFVAAFVGHASFVPARLQGEEIVTEVGRFPYNGNFSGPDAMALFSPEDITILHDETGGATVVGREFQGAQNLYTVRLTSGLTLRSSQPSGIVYPLGTKVRVVPSDTLGNLFLLPSDTRDQSAED